MTTVTAARAPTITYVPRGCSFHTRGPPSATDRIVAGRCYRRFLTPAKCRKGIAHRAMTFTNGTCSAHAGRRSPSVWLSCSRTRSPHVATPFQDQKHTPLRIHSSHFATCNLDPCTLPKSESDSVKWQVIAVKRGFSRKGHAINGMRRSVGASGHNRVGIFLDVRLVKVYRSCETPFRPL